MNKLQNLILGWSKDIRKVTSMQHDIKKGTTSQEINFWAQMENSLRSITEWMVRDDVKMILDILMQSTMHRKSVLTLRNESQITQHITKAKNYNSLLKDIPVNDLLEATNLKQMAFAVKSIFAVLCRIRTFSHYETTQYNPARAIDLAECI